MDYDAVVADYPHAISLMLENSYVKGLDAIQKFAAKIAEVKQTQKDSSEILL